MSTIYQIITVSLAVSFTILVLEKTGLREKLRDLSGKTLFADMLECDFCLGFWLSVLITVGLLLSGYEISFLMPIYTAPFIRRIL